MEGAKPLGDGKTLLQAVRKGVVRRPEKKAPEAEQRETSVADCAVGSVAIDGASEGMHVW